MLKFMSSLVLLLLSYTLVFASALPPPKEGEPLPDIVLPAPQDADVQRYLVCSGGLDAGMLGPMAGI